MLPRASMRWIAMFALLALPSIGCGAAPLDDDESLDSLEAAASANDGAKVLAIRYEAQQTGYWCGPAAARIAISARMAPPSQAQLVPILRTDQGGTDSVHDIVRGLNQYVGGNQYEARPLYVGKLANVAKDRLWKDVVTSVDNNFPLVVNIVAENYNRPRNYPAGTWYHYVTAIGYNPATKQVYIADPARFGGVEKFWLPLDQLASLTAKRGYTAWGPKGTRCEGGNGSAQGDIEKKFLALGGCGSFLGAPTTGEMTTPDGNGRYTVFQKGSIYWTPKLGAHEVHGVIRDEWKARGWEAGALGYPTADEQATSDGGRRVGKFERGEVYFKPETAGTVIVYGKIYEKWVEIGREAELGYPTKTEYEENGLRRSDFERGSIVWDPSTKVATVMKN